MLNLHRRQPILVSQRRGVIRHSLIPLRPQQWRGIRHRFRYHPAPNILHRRRNRIPTNNPVGGVLPTSHRHQPGRHPRHRMVTGQIRGGLRRPTHQRPQPRIHAHNIRHRDRVPHLLIHMRQNIVNIRPGCRRIRQILIPISIGRTNNPILPPRDHKQHRLLGHKTQCSIRIQTITRHHDMHPLRRPHRKRPRHPGKLMDLLRPHPRGINKHIRR